MPPAALEHDCEPPIRLRPDERSPLLLVDVVQQFQVESAERYRARDVTGDGRPETFCNRFACDVAEAAGVPLPYMLVNDLVMWLATAPGRLAGWQQVEEADARRAAELGELAVACYYNRNGGHGHIAVLVPPRPGDAPCRTYIAQAGAHNFSHGTLQSGFGGLPVSFFLHNHTRTSR